MKFFVDSANIEEITKLKNLGIADGVTTNPSLILKAGRNFQSIWSESVQPIMSVKC